MMELMCNHLTLFLLMILSAQLFGHIVPEEDEEEMDEDFELPVAALSPEM